MNARNKLNSAYIGGSFLIAGGAGYAANSWWVFGIVLIVLLAIHLNDGNIRPQNHPK